MFFFFFLPLTFRQVFGQGLHIVCSVLPGGVGAQVSTHRLHLLLKGCLWVLLGSLQRRQKTFTEGGDVIATSVILDI